MLDAIAGMNAITPRQATAYAAAALGLRPQTPPNDCTAVPAATNVWGFFCDYFVQWWDAQPRSA